jgi:uncharacterized RDD family membrane protein YckC
VAEVVTGEAVVLDLAVARFPTRLLAVLLDIAVQLPVLVIVEVIVNKTVGQHLNEASAASVKILGLVLVVVGYPVIFETLSRGKTLGKMALGLRVVADDGSPERFRQALIRALTAAFVEIWSLALAGLFLDPLLAIVGLIGIPAGVITSMASAKGKRIGDLFAGTFVIQERVPRTADLPAPLSQVPPPLAEWAQHLELSRLSDSAAATASSYLRRYYQLAEPARTQLGAQIAATVAAQVSPPPLPGTPATAYLAAVLAVRRQRELARVRDWQAAQAHAWTASGQAAAAPPTPPPAGPAPADGTSPIEPAPAGGTAPIEPAEAITPQVATDADAPPKEDFGFAAPF